MTALDSQAAAMIESLADLGAPRLIDQSPQAARATYALQREFGPVVEDVASVEDIVIDGPAGDLALRVTIPDGADEPGVVVGFHGGGWVLGDLDSHDAIFRMVANRSGHVVVTVDYRLAPEHPFPAAFEDARAATAWAARHAGDYGADGARLAVAGDSAGGNLAATVCIDARDHDGPPIAAQALIYPVIDHDFDRASYLANADGYLLTRATMQWFWDHYVPDPASRDDPRVAPLAADDLAGLPPALVITGGFDPLRDEGRAYAGALAAADVAVDDVCFDGLVHGFFSYPHVIHETLAAHDLVGQWLRDRLT